MFALPSTPSLARCHALLWRALRPITSNGSPYSLAEHDELQVTDAPPLVQERLEAWWRAMLCPSSCATTRTAVVPFIHVCSPGSSPRPAQPQLDCCGKT